MQPDNPKRRSYLFTLRLWSEETTDGQIEWRGRLYNAATGHVRHFRDWASLIPLLLAMLREAEDNSSARSSTTPDS